MKTLGQMVRELRKENGYSQAELAALVRIAPQTVGHIENNSDRHIPSPYLLVALSEALSADYDDLNDARSYTKRSMSMKLPKPRLERYETHPIYQCDSFVATSDWHVPAQDIDFANKVIDLAVDWGVEVFSIGGDFANFSNFARFSPPRGYSFKDELEQMRRVLDVLTNTFSFVIHKQGNHEARLMDRVLKNQIDAEDFGRLVSHSDNFYTSDFWYTEFDTPYGKWMTCHPENISVYPQKVAQDLENTKFPDYNVIVEHSHAFGMGRTRDGKRWVISSGMMGDPRRLDYYILKASSTTQMMQGCVIVKEGQPYILHPKTNFNALKEMY